MKRMGDSGVPAPLEWHAMPEAAVLERLASFREGLGSNQVAERQREFGRNVLPTKQAPTLPVIFLHQIASPLIYILLAAGVVAIGMGDASDAGFIFGVVLLNAGLGAYQEHKAEKSAASLQQMLRISARVRRREGTLEIAAEELVPGDIVYLESGVRVPADIRLLDANNLAIDEAFLTGESVPAEKRVTPLAPDLPVADRHNMAFAGAMVTVGRGLGVVVATALRTEVGKIAKTVTLAEGTKPPLVIRMEKFAHQVSWAVLGACLLLGGVAIGRGMPMVDVFFLAVALAVSAIPEGLPVAMTVALSIGTSRMAKRNVIVRRLTAVEGLGSCTFIASDKTGTLTLNKQTVQSVWVPWSGRFVTNGAQGGTRRMDGEPVSESEQQNVARLTRLGMIASEAAAKRGAGGDWEFSGDAMDVAF